ncbi:hypothetical protein AVEN_198493-1 [Araneus ventricosus]|uniref:Uncharacterized protein n=1 Tax=Araneus ventricosus TaxID=182803 RepID=A0A4Y2JM38_ARAVE|nr:hypothetical protein AVEN_198493-1 [Araneus ventricosus]
MASVAEGEDRTPPPLVPAPDTLHLQLNRLNGHGTEGEDRFDLKKDGGTSNTTNMPFIYNKLKPTFTCSLGTHANSRKPNKTESTEG